MGNTNELYAKLSEVMRSCKDKNFGYDMTPEQLKRYLDKNLHYMLIDSPTPDAALCIMQDGEVGFISTPYVGFRGKRKLIAGFKAYVRGANMGWLWCKVQPNNHVVRGLVERLGFEAVDVLANRAILYIYKGA